MCESIEEWKTVWRKRSQSFIGGLEKSVPWYVTPMVHPRKQLAPQRTLRGTRWHAAPMQVTWQVLGPGLGILELLGSFGRVRVGACGLRAFWGELFGIHFRKKSLYTNFFGRKFRACRRPAFDRPNFGDHQDQHPPGCFPPQQGP